MSDRSAVSAHRDAPLGSGALALAAVCGAALGALAKLMGSYGRTLEQDGTPLVMLGMGTAIWVTAGFLVARRFAKGRDLTDGSVWASTAMAVYLSAWLLAYTAVFGLQQDGGFPAAWLNERLYFILAPAAGVALGCIAAASWRTDWLGDACLVAPVAWSLPEAGLAWSFGWQYLLVAGLPALMLASVPVVTARRRVSLPTLVATLILGGITIWMLLRAVSSGKI